MAIPGSVPAPPDAWRDCVPGLMVLLHETPDHGPVRSRWIAPQESAGLTAREDEAARTALGDALDFAGRHPSLATDALYRAADICGTKRIIDGATVQRALRKAPRGGFALTPDLARAWLARHAGNVSAASRAAGLPRTTFRKLLAAPGTEPAVAVAERRVDDALDRRPPG